MLDLVCLIFFLEFVILCISHDQGMYQTCTETHATALAQHNPPILTLFLGERGILLKFMRE